MKTLPVSSDVLPAIFCVEAENEVYSKIKSDEEKGQQERGRGGERKIEGQGCSHLIYIFNTSTILQSANHR